MFLPTNKSAFNNVYFPTKPLVFIDQYLYLVKCSQSGLEIWHIKIWLN